jgi:hypothetical protein
MMKILKESGSEFLKFYRIKGSELDAEVRKEVEDTDVLNHAVKKHDEVRVHMFMLILSILAYEVSHLTVHDHFVIEMLEDIRSTHFGWDPVYCRYEDSEAHFHNVLIAPIVLHALCLVWVFTRAIRAKMFNIPDRHSRPWYTYPGLYIFIGNIVVIIVGY